MRICSGAGCLRAVPDSVRYCDECQPRVTPGDGAKVHTLGYDARIDRLLKSLRWQKLRAQVVREQPMCARCRRHVTEIVDHIVPAPTAVAQALASGRYPFDASAGYFLRSNLQGLCRSCHRDKTAEDKAHTGPWPDVVTQELTWLKERGPRKWSF